MKHRTGITVPIAMVILERLTWRDSSCHLARVNDEPAGCPVDPKMKNSQERVRLSDGVRKRDIQRPLCQLAVDVLPPGCVELRSRRPVFLSAPVNESRAAGAKQEDRARSDSP